MESPWEIPVVLQELIYLPLEIHRYFAFGIYTLAGGNIFDVFEDGGESCSHARECLTCWFSASYPIIEDKEPLLIKSDNLTQWPFSSMRKFVR